MEALTMAGVGDSPITVGAVYPEGPSQLLWVQLNGREIALTHDSDYNLQDLNQVSPAGSPARAQLEAFIEMWNRAYTAMDDVWPKSLEQATFIPGLHYPAARR